MHNTRYIIVFFLIFTASTYSMDKNPNTFPSRGHQQLAINAMQSAKQKCIEKTTNRKNTDAFRAAEQQYMQTVEKVRQTGPAIVNNQAAFSDFKVFDGKLEEAVKTENYKEITPAFADKYKSTLELVNTTHKELGQQLRTFNKPTMVDVETQTDPEPVEIKAAFNNTKKDLTQKHPKETSIQRFQAGLLHLLDFLSEKEQEEVFNRFDKADMETIKTIGSKYFPFSLEEADKVSAPATQPATGILTPKQKNKKSKKHKKLQLATGSVTNAKPELVAGMKSAEVALIQASKELLQISQNCQKLKQSASDQKALELAAFNHLDSIDKSNQQIALEQMQPQPSAAPKQTPLNTELRHVLDQKLQEILGDGKVVSGKQMAQLTTQHPDLFNREFLQKQKEALEKKKLLKKRLSLNTRAGRPERREVINRSRLLGANITKAPDGINDIIHFTAQAIDEAELLGVSAKKTDQKLIRQNILSLHKPYK